uniref:Polypeptide N-acetylgalactosaminyltransferase n=1 Tax=Schistocephalus solidus TaxID=70667 RepID=A0A0X3PIS1_SCHSO
MKMFEKRLAIKIISSLLILWVFLQFFLVNLLNSSGRRSSIIVNEGGNASDSGIFNNIFKPVGGSWLQLSNLLSQFGGLGNGGLGENGQPVHLPANLMADAKAKFHIHQFDVVVSDLISVNRSLPDRRNHRCLSQNYDKEAAASGLNSSIIIVFHNEAWSTLLRTVHSVLNRTPANLLHEILLVDDASDKDHLRKSLEQYVTNLNGKVKLLRLKTRSGLVRARLHGAAHATGSTITFLDAHCEVTIGWFEPLLAQIHKNPRSVVCPAIDVISDTTFGYMESTDSTWGVFDWGLNFDWSTSSERENRRRGHDAVAPIRTPAMAGGLFTIRRDYFYELGSYDDGMQVWGGENVEMSLRVWQCHGELLIMPCSRVGHVFRKVSPYSWPGGTTSVLHNNHLRTARVWLDEFLEYSLNFLPAWRDFDYGNISRRIELRKKLKCHTFAWYLEKVFPESTFRLQTTHLGQIKSEEADLCMDSKPPRHHSSVSVAPCHGNGAGQVFVITARGEIVSSTGCLQAQRSQDALYSKGCTGAGGIQEFRYDNETKRFLHIESQLCVRFAAVGQDQRVFLDDCSATSGVRWILPPAFKNSTAKG